MAKKQDTKLQDLEQRVTELDNQLKRAVADYHNLEKRVAEGYFIGGNLYTLCNLVGTSYFPSVDSLNNAILFWEEVGSPLNEIAQRLYQLKYLGVFERISGMLIGKIKYIKPMREEGIQVSTAKELVLNILEDYKFPIMSNLDFGHFTVNIPMPIGIKVFFDTAKKELNFLESAVI